MDWLWANPGLIEEAVFGLKTIDLDFFNHHDQHTSETDQSPIQRHLYRITSNSADAFLQVNE